MEAQWFFCEAQTLDALASMVEERMAYHNAARRDSSLNYVACFDVLKKKRVASQSGGHRKAVETVGSCTWRSCPRSRSPTTMAAVPRLP